MRKVVARSLVLLAALGASPAGSAELELGLEAGAVYDDNVFSTPEDRESDVAGRIGPRLRALDEGGALGWEVYYRPVYQRYLDLRDADDWDHDAYAALRWSISPRTTLRLSERFLDASNVNQALVAAAGADPTVEPTFRVGTSRSQYNQLEASLEHALAARHLVSLAAARYDTSYDESADETAVTALQASYLYLLTPLDRIGVGLSGTQQEVDYEAFEGRTTRFYNASLRWVRQFDPTLALDVSAGPAWIDESDPETVDLLPEQSRYPVISTGEGLAPVRASTCPLNGEGRRFLDERCRGFGRGTPFLDAAFLSESADLPRIGGTPSSDSDVTYFAAISLTKEWRSVSGTLSYERDASTSAQLSGVVSDTVSTHVTWHPPALRWGVSLYAVLERRELPNGGFTIQEIVEPATVAGVSDVAEAVGFSYVKTSSSANVDDYLAGLYVTYDLLAGRAASGHQAQLYLNVAWQRQELDGEAARSTRWDRLRVVAGVIYTLPRIRLPF